MTCILCQNSATLKMLDGRFYHCDICDCIMKPKSSYLREEEEKERYNLHQNDANESGYRAFISPVVEQITKEYFSYEKGLDFGCGKDSALFAMLKEYRYNIKQYDPYYFNQNELLNERYNYIACIEVVEHFYDAKKEFERLKNMLEKGGALYIMTEIYDEGTNFENWYYKEDPTHVIFYSKKSFEWIKKYYNFSSLMIHGRIIKLGV